VAPTVDVFLVWQVAVSSLAVVVLAISTYWSMPRAPRAARFSLTAVRHVLRFAGGMAIIAALSMILMQIDKLILSRMLTLRDFGIYSLATTAAGSLYMSVSPITAAVYPRLCQFRAHDEMDSFNLVFHQAAQYIAVITGSLASVMIVFAPEILLLWIGDREMAAEAARILRWLAAGTLLNCLMWIPYQAQLAHVWTRLSIGINAVSIVIIVPAMIVCVSLRGPVGAAWCWLILNGAYVLVGAPMMFRRILVSEGRVWFWRDTICPLTVGVAVALAVRGLWEAPSGSTLNAARLLLATCLVLVASALAASGVRVRMLRLLSNPDSATRGAA